MAMMINSINTNLDAFLPVSILNQGIRANQKEVQRASATDLNADKVIDNISAYTIEESLRIRTRMLNQANQNIQNDTALLKTAQGSGSSIVNSIKEIQKLALSATDESLTDEDRLVIQKDINRLVEQISSVSQITFNGRKLIDGTATTGNPAIAGTLSNNSLYSGTSAATLLTDLKSSGGASLGIEASDRITASYVQDGKIYTTSFTAGTNTLEDIFVNLNSITGMSLTDTAFVGGAQGILREPVEPPAPIEPPKPIAPTKPTAPTAPIAPTAPQAVSQPEIPRDFVPSSLPNVNDYPTNDEFVAAEEIYDAVQSGTAKVIEPPNDPTDANYANDLADYNTAVSNYGAKSYQDRIKEITDYEQYLQKKDAYDLEVVKYNAALADYNAAYAKYEDYLANNSGLTNETSGIYNYNGYVGRKNAYDSAQPGFNAAYERFADYVATAPDYREAYANYEAHLPTETPGTINQERTRAVAGYRDYVNWNGNYSTASDAYEKYGDYLDAYSGLVTQYEKDLEEYDRRYPKYLAYSKDYTENFHPQYEEDLANYRIMTANVVQHDSNGFSVTAREAGLERQISGVSINVTDSSGNAKETATSVLNNFRTTTFAADATEDNSVYFQISETVGQMLNLGFDDMRAEAFGLKGANGNIINISTKADADAALATIDNALNKATEQLQMIGSSEKKLGYISDSLSLEISNIQEPDWTVRNGGTAKTLTLYVMDLFNNNPAQSMFAMANQHSSVVLNLLR